MLLVVAVAAITPIIIVTRAFFVVHAATVPDAAPSLVEAEVQTESFTCGMHAIHAVYRAYGLDPVAERVRWRLGVDTKAVFWMEDSTGALHPDMYLVLRQDGFEVHSLELSAANAHDALLGHLDGGHMAILLIKRRENGHLHWVACQGRDGDRYRVLDSLFDQPLLEGRDYTQRHVVTALAVAPSGRLQTGVWESLGHLRDGSTELDAFRKRMQELASP